MKQKSQEGDDQLGEGHVSKSNKNRGRAGQGRAGQRKPRLATGGTDRCRCSTGGYLRPLCESRVSIKSHKGLMKSLKPGPSQCAQCAATPLAGCLTPRRVISGCQPAPLAGLFTFFFFLLIFFHCRINSLVAHLHSS